MEFCWELFLGIGHGVSIGPIIVKVGALHHSMVSSLAKKRVIPGGNVPLNQEHCFHDPDHPIRESSIGCLAASHACGSAEGDWVHKAEWLQECLLLLECLVKLGMPCRPALAIHLFNFCHSSLKQSSGEHTGSHCPFPLINLFSHLENGVISGTYKGPHGGVIRGHLFSFLCLLSSGVPLMLFLPHRGHIVEQMLP